MQERSGAKLNRKGFPDVGSVSEMGFFHNKDDAISAMHENALDIRECVYNYGMVIEQPPGLYEVSTPETRTYFAWDDERQGFFEAEEPEAMNNYGY